MSRQKSTTPTLQGDWYLEIDDSETSSTTFDRAVSCLLQHEARSGKSVLGKVTDDALKTVLHKWCITPEMSRSLENAIRSLYNKLHDSTAATTNQDSWSRCTYADIDQHLQSESTALNTVGKWISREGLTLSEAFVESGIDSLQEVCMFDGDLSVFSQDAWGARVIPFGSVPLHWADALQSKAREYDRCLWRAKTSFFDSMGAPYVTDPTEIAVPIEDTISSLIGLEEVLQADMHGLPPAQIKLREEVSAAALHGKNVLKRLGDSGATPDEKLAVVNEAFETFDRAGKALSGLRIPYDRPDEEKVMKLD